MSPILAGRLVIIESPGKHIHCCCSATQSCLTLCSPMDCRMPSLPFPHHLSKFAGWGHPAISHNRGQIREDLQARILEWVATPFSRGSFQPRDRTWVSCIAVRFFTIWATREALCYIFFIYEALCYIFFNNEILNLVLIMCTT